MAEFKNIKKLLFLSAIVIAMTVTVAQQTALAHPGGLDKDGCHHDGKNYHCHGTPQSTSTGQTSTYSGSRSTSSIDANEHLRFMRLIDSLPEQDPKPRSEYDKAMDVFRRQRGEKTHEEGPKHKESYYQKIWCDQQGGVMEVVIPNGRIDCLTATHAVEVDFMKKWAESIGQSLFYAKSTGKKAGVLLIINPIKDSNKLENIRKTIEENGIDLWTINR